MDRLDIALWDLAGKKYGLSVAKLLGAVSGASTHLRKYLSWAERTRRTPTARKPLAEYALACKQAGFVRLQDPWLDRRQCSSEAANVLGVREAVGSDFTLMLDPACQLRTWMDALYVGRGL